MFLLPDHARTIWTDVQAFRYTLPSLGVQASFAILHLKIDPVLSSQAQHSDNLFNKFIGSAKTDPVQFEGGFREGLLKDKFVFFKLKKPYT